MKAVSANVVRGLPVGSQVPTCDNSGAKLVEIITVLGHKTVKGRRAAAGVGDMCIVAVKRGKRFDQRHIYLPGLRTLCAHLEHTQGRRIFANLQQQLRLQ